MHTSQIYHPITKTITRFWFDSPTVARPMKEDMPANMDSRLFPWECREAVSACKAVDDRGETIRGLGRQGGGSWLPGSRGVNVMGPSQLRGLSNPRDRQAARR